MRRRSILLAVCLILCSALLPLSCASGEQRYSVTYLDVFDTVTEFSAYCGSRKAFDAAAEAVHAELLRLHRLCDIYHSYEGQTNLFSVNQSAADEKLSLDADLMKILEYGKRFYGLIGGKLNIAMGSLISLWHDCMEQGDHAVLPSEDDLRAASGHIGFDAVSMDGRLVSRSDRDVRFDVGAIAKGYAAESAAAAARSSGLKDFSLHIGGNVLVSGKKPTGNWVIGVQDPDGGIFTKLYLTDISAVTSGDYQRFVEIDGVRYHHIIDPDTRHPADGFRSVTVVCPDSFAADALSTSLFCMPVESGKKLASQFGAEVLWILPDGSAVRTDGFSKYEE